MFLNIYIIGPINLRQVLFLFKRLPSEKTIYRRMVCQNSGKILTAETFHEILKGSSCGHIDKHFCKMFALQSFVLKK